MRKAKIVLAKFSINATKVAFFKKNKCYNPFQV